MFFWMIGWGGSSSSNGDAVIGDVLPSMADTNDGLFSAGADVTGSATNLGGLDGDVGAGAAGAFDDFEDGDFDYDEFE